MSTKTSDLLTIQERAVFESISDIFFLLNSEWEFIYLNAKAEELFNKSKEELIGKNIWQEIPEIKKTTFYDNYVKSVEKNKAHQFQEYFEDLDVYFEVSLYPSDLGLSVYAKNITEKRKAEEKLAESEKKYRSLFETMSQGVIYHKRNGDILSINSAAKKRLKFFNGDLKNITNIFEKWFLVNEEGNSISSTDFPSIKAIEIKDKIENQVIGFINKKNSDVIWLKVSTIPLFEGKNDIPYLIYTTFTDITKLKKTKLTIDKITKEKEENIALLNSLLSNAPVGFAFFDIDLKYAKVNDFLAEVNNISKEDHIGKKLDETFFDASKTMIPIINTVFKTGASILNVELEVNKNNEKTTKNWLAGFYPIYNTKGAIKYVGTVLSEITEMKEAEKALSDSERKMRNIFESDMLGIVYSKFDGTITDANNAFLEMLGYSTSELQEGKLNWQDLTPPEFKKVSAWAIKELRSKGFSKPFEKEYFHKNGKRIPILMGASLVSDNENADSVTYILDISDRKRLEKQKDEFISIASHELKTPLTSLQAYIQLIDKLKNKIENPNLCNYINKTKIHLDRLTILINDLLDVSKIEAGKMEFNKETFNLKELISNCIEDFKPVAPSYKIKLHSKNSIIITADKYRIEQVFTNLLSNAVKYSPDNKNINVFIKNNGKTSSVSIKDNGIGIPKNKQKNLFNRFYRVEEISTRFSGLGIGLYISSQIIKRHGGNIWLTSECGKGSTFSFSIPTKGGDSSE